MDSSSGPSSPDSDMGACCSPEELRCHVMDRNKRIRASARERRRRHVLNRALENLRQRIPCIHQNPQRLSKIEILRTAIEYITLLNYYLSNPSTTILNYDTQENQGAETIYATYPIKAAPNFSSTETTFRQPFLENSETCPVLPGEWNPYGLRQETQRPGTLFGFQTEDLYMS